jgi:hypothetical protein
MVPGEVTAAGEWSQNVALEMAAYKCVTSKSDKIGPRVAHRINFPPPKPTAMNYFRSCYTELALIIFKTEYCIEEQEY